MNDYLVYIMCSEYEADDIRYFSQSWFREHHLRYKTHRSYPESRWNTPSIEDPIEIWVTYRAPKGLQLSRKDALLAAVDFFHAVMIRFDSIENFATDF